LTGLPDVLGVCPPFADFVSMI
jgi:hypothetical protein